MQQTTQILKNSYNHGYTDEETEERLKELEKDELIDFIMWNFNRGRFTDYIKN